MFPAFDRDTILPGLYRDERLIAVHKPAGMVVYPTDLARTTDGTRAGASFQ